MYDRKYNGMRLSSCFVLHASMIRELISLRKPNVDVAQKFTFIAQLINWVAIWETLKFPLWFLLEVPIHKPS